MKTDLCGIFRGFVWVVSFALVLMGVTACSSSDDKSVAGGSSEDAGIIAIKDLDVAGVTQKGPFVKGSVVTVQGIDCKTLQLTDEHFEGEVKSDKGDFTVKEVSLKSSCALFEVTGLYRSEITGKKSSKELTLRALTDLKDRENVNINVLTNLEYERLLYLVTEKGKTFAEAKAQAEAEVLAAFDIAGSFEEFENLNIFESGDGNAALLAVSVMMQAETDDAGLAKRMEKFADSFAETGNWKDSATKAAIADWAADAIAGNGLDSIRKNIESWNVGDTVAAFEKYITAEFPDTVILSSSSKDVEPAETSSSSSAKSSSSSSDSLSGNVTKEAYLNPEIKYDSIVDSRDGQVYKTVKIGNQTWMAQNLNYADSVKTPSLVGRTGCYVDGDPDCKWSGRGYSWAAAIDSMALANDSENPVMCGYNRSCGFVSQVRGICPEGWHLPDTTEWNDLFAAVGGREVAGLHLKAKMGWHADSNGVDDFGFSAIATDFSVDVYGDRVYGHHTNFWSTVENGLTKSATAYLGAASEAASISDGSPKYAGSTLNGQRYAGYMIRCVRDYLATPSSNSVKTLGGWSWKVPKESRMNPDFAYGELTDSRDGKTYKTTKIGSQTWMAENLNYADTNAMPSLKAESFCYGNDAKNCEVAGRLYIWSDSLGRVCPEGTHLPSLSEWQTLFAEVGGDTVALTSLVTHSGWDYAWRDVQDYLENGTDKYGFSVMPVGAMYGSGDFRSDGLGAFFWISDAAKNIVFGAPAGVMSVVETRPTYGRSVRCLKD